MIGLSPNNKSDAASIKLGVPEGLVLGPLLFLFFLFIYNNIYTEMPSSARLV